MIPTYEELMLPVLKLYKEHSNWDGKTLTKTIADDFNLSDLDRGNLIPSGTKTRIYDRVTWARWYLKAAGFLHSPKRNHFHITESGISYLKNDGSTLDQQSLKQFPDYINHIEKREKEKKHKKTLSTHSEPLLNEKGGLGPEELIQKHADELKERLAEELLSAVYDMPPASFEKLCVDLLEKMGYGTGKVTQYIADGGIDGIIDEDRLGLSKIYIQAKRWKNNVGRPEVQKFSGAMTGAGVSKGVMMTSASFSAEATAWAENLQTAQLVLVDGDRLAHLMIEHNIGVSTANVYTLKMLDSDYFDVN